jgi:hypothetical protein
MDIPRLESMRSYWEEYPPLHIAFAAFAGFKSGKKSNRMSDSDIREMMAQFPQAPTVPK